MQYDEALARAVWAAEYVVAYRDHLERFVRMEPFDVCDKMEKWQQEAAHLARETADERVRQVQAEFAAGDNGQEGG
jgi:hypothetical protein